MHYRAGEVWKGRERVASRLGKERDMGRRSGGLQFNQILRTVSGLMA